MIQKERGRVLSMDIGGTKIMVALVDEDRILERRVSATRLGSSPKDIIGDALALGRDLVARADRVAAAVTGRVSDGVWSALNVATLHIAEAFPLVETLEKNLGLPSFAVNDAQAAAWAEFCYGAARCKNMVFLTVSTGVGGGIVIDGHLLTGRSGIAGHFGITGQFDADLFEDSVSGRWMAAEAARCGGPAASDARTVFEEASRGIQWAQDILDRSATRMAGMLSDIQLTFDPDVIILGGGIGMRSEYRALVEGKLSALPDYARPVVAQAQFGAEAGVIGAAALGKQKTKF